MTENSLPNLLWVDLETTGLEPDEHLPLEIAVAVTDSDLNVLYERSYVIYQPLVLNDLSDWVIETHSKNGLLAEVAQSNWTVPEVEFQLVTTMLPRWLWPNLNEKPPLCGSTISFDRGWLKRWFPEFYSHIHYRSIDVSSIKELMKRWQPEDAVSRRDTSAHRAMSDIQDSIDELRSYRLALGWGIEPNFELIT